MRTRTRNALLVVLAATLAAGGLWLFTRDTTDPRYAWAEAADGVCLRAANATLDVDVPTSFRDGDAIRSWAGQLATVQAQLADDLERLDAPGAAQELATVVVEQTRAREGLYAALAEPDSELPDPDTGEGGPGREIAATYEAVSAAVAQWGGAVCGRNPLEPGAASGPTPHQRWIGALEEVCIAAQERFEKADRIADPTDPAGYLRELTSGAELLSHRLRAVGPPADSEHTDRYNLLVERAETLAGAVASGDLDAARGANGEFRAAAGELELVRCASGVTASQEDPTNLLAEPDFLAPSGVGVDGGQVTDAAAVAGYAASQLMFAARPEAADAYGTRALVGRVVGQEVTGVSGDVPASPTAVSISERRLPNPGAEPAESNPWVVGVAVADSSGRCMWSQMFGVDVLYGYTPPAPAAGPCTGDAAAAAYTP